MTCSASIATLSEVTVSPKHATFALLWRRVISASLTSRMTPPLAPGTLFAAMQMPWPLPHTATPNLARPAATACATAAPKWG